MSTAITVLLLLFCSEKTSSTFVHRSPKEFKRFDDWVAESIFTVNWCSSKLQCNHSKNVMCTRNRADVVRIRKNCLGLRETATPEFRRQMLHLHNELRNDVALGKTPVPSASNLRQLSWNVIAEATASVWISYCRVGRADCRKTPYSPDGLGQNYFLLGTDTANTGLREYPPDSVPSFKAWEAALSFMDFGLVKNFSYQKSMLDSAAQIIYAKTTSVGCSESTYLQAGFKFRVLVCNYDKPPETNQSLFHIGEACSDCPQGTACNNDSVYPNLCAAPGDDETRGVPIDTEELLAALVSVANFVNLSLQLFILSASIEALLH